MASSYQSKLVTNELVLCLDAANPDSFQIGRDSLNDLNNNGINGTLVNIPTYVSYSPANTTDPDYISGVGVGGTTSGGNGLVVISY